MNAHNKQLRKERLAPAAEIRRKYRGKSLQEIGDALGISKQAVGRILRK